MEAPLVEKTDLNKSHASSKHDHKSHDGHDAANKKVDQDKASENINVRAAVIHLIGDVI